MPISAVSLAKIQDFIPTEKITDFGDRASVALQVVLLGMLIVFGSLAVIWGVLEIMGAFFKKKERAAKEAAEKAEAEKTANAEETALTEASAENTSAEDEGELIAAITAAISVMLDKPQSGFRVVSFSRANREAYRKNNRI